MHHEEAKNFLDEIVEQLHDDSKMTDDLAEKAEQLEHIYNGRLDVTDQSATSGLDSPPARSKTGKS